MHHFGDTGTPLWKDCLNEANVLSDVLIDRWALLMLDVKDASPYIAETCVSTSETAKLSKVPRVCLNVTIR